VADPYVLGIDIGGTTTKLAMVRAGGEATSGQPYTIVAQTAIETLPQQSAAQFVQRIAAAARPLMATAPTRPVGIGIGSPGLIDHRRGVVVLCTNIPNLTGFALRDELSAAMDLPVDVQNDANAAALGEFLFGQGRGTQNLIVLMLGTGVGGGVICDGRLLTGADNAAAELGHVKVDFADDAAPCGCGRTGCLEAYAGIAGIGRIARRQLMRAGDRATSLRVDGDLTTRRITEAARGGDVVARDTLFEVGAYLGRGIANLIDTFNPEKIVLAGGASAAIDLLMPGIRQSMDRWCLFEFTRKRALIERTSLPETVAVLGPAAVFLSARKQ